MSIEAGPVVLGGVEGKPWTIEEIDLVVDAYMYMLRMQESGQSINKSECNRIVKARLPARSLFSITRKHSNISAVLTLLGVQSLQGYHPLFNFQKALADRVEKALENDHSFDVLARQRISAPVQNPVLADYLGVVVPPPITLKQEAAARVALLAGRSGVQRDYLAREAMNISMGLAGEHVALEFERASLRLAGLFSLADRVEHVSKTRGDGLGYDILSFNIDGTPRYIEVKTTSYGIHTPIFVSPNEISASTQASNAFWLYRVFNLRSSPRLYMVRGAIPDSFELEPASYRASLRQQATCKNSNL